MSSSRASQALRVVVRHVGIVAGNKVFTSWARVNFLGTFGAITFTWLVRLCRAWLAFGVVLDLDLVLACHKVLAFWALPPLVPAPCPVVGSILVVAVVARAAHGVVLQLLVVRSCTEPKARSADGSLQRAGAVDGGRVVGKVPFVFARGLLVALLPKMFLGLLELHGWAVYALASGDDAVSVEVLALAAGGPRRTRAFFFQTEVGEVLGLAACRLCIARLLLMALLGLVRSNEVR